MLIKLVNEYNYIQLLQVKESLSQIKTKIVQFLFIESFSIAVLAVFKLSKSPSIKILGINGKLFPILIKKQVNFIFIYR